MTLWTVAHQARLWNSPGKNTGVGCHFLLQGIFPTQGSNPGLLHCGQTLYWLSHQGSHCIYIYIYTHTQLIEKLYLEKGKATHSSILAWRIPWTSPWVTKSRIWLSNFHFHFSLYLYIHTQLGIDIHTQLVEKNIYMYIHMYMCRQYVYIFMCVCVYFSQHSL